MALTARQDRRGARARPAAPPRARAASAGQRDRHRSRRAAGGHADARRPAAGRGRRAHRVLQRLGDDPNGGRRDPPRRQQLRGTPGLLSRNRAHRGPGPGADRGRERHPAPATGRGRRGRDPRVGGRPADPSTRGAPLGRRAGVLGRGPGLARARRHPRAPRATTTARRTRDREDVVSDREGQDHPASRYGRHLQPDRRAADRVRPAFRAATDRGIGASTRPARHPSHRR